MKVLFILIAVCVLVLMHARIVPQASAYVIESLGSYKGTWGNGLHFMVPFIERISNKVSLKEQVEDFPPQPVITKDNVTMQIDTVVYFKIFDPKLFTYGVEHPVMALGNLTATTLRNIIGELELDETLTSREIINSKMREVLDEATDAWGLRITRVELKNIIPPTEIQEAMEKQMKAERERRRTLLEAEAHKEAVVARAQGDKQAQILDAEAEKEASIAKAAGRAEALRLVYEAEAQGLELLKKSAPDNGVLELKRLEALKALGDGQATKLIVPSDVVDLTSALSLISEVMDRRQPTRKPAEPIIEDPDICCGSSQVKY